MGGVLQMANLRRTNASVEAQLAMLPSCLPSVDGANGSSFNARRLLCMRMDPYCSPAPLGRQMRDAVNAALFLLAILSCWFFSSLCASTETANWPGAVGRKYDRGWEGAGRATRSPFRSRCCRRLRVEFPHAGQAAFLYFVLRSHQHNNHVCSVGSYLRGEAGVEVRPDQGRGNSMAEYLIFPKEYTVDEAGGSGSAEKNDGWRPKELARGKKGCRPGGATR